MPENMYKNLRILESIISNNWFDRTSFQTSNYICPSIYSKGMMFTQWMAAK